MNKSIVIGTVVFLALASCAQQQEATEPELVPEISAEKTIHFSTRPIATRTTFGEAQTDAQGNVTYPCYWTGNDMQVKISLNYEYSVVAGVNTDETDSDGNIIRSSFDASFNEVDTSDPYTFYLVSPADALLWASADRSAVSVNISANQTPSKTSVDEAAQILVAKSDSYTSLPDNVEVDFSHITSYGKLTLTNLTVPEGASLTSITLISEEQPLTGSWYYYFQDGSIAEKEGSSSLTINTSNIDVTAGDPIWFAAAPVAMAGKKLSVRANFSDASYLERTITLNSNFNFASGKIMKFSVNMANAMAGSNKVDASSEEEVYQLVTSTSSLSAGDEIIIVNSTTPTYAMTATSSSSGLSAVAKDAESGFTLGDDGYIRILSGSEVNTMMVKTISGSSIVIYDGGSNYLGYTSSSSGGGPGQSSSRYLSMSTTSSTWTLTISNGSASMYISGSGGMGNSKYYIRYSNNYFNVSTSSGTVAIYKKATVKTTTEVDLSNDAVCGYSDFGAYLSGQNLVYNATTDQISREYGNDGTLTFSIIDPTGDQAVEFSGIPSSIGLGDNFNLGLTYISGITTQISNTYSVYVVKEEGHTLWLTDGAGNGFIVKR